MLAVDVGSLSNCACQGQFLPVVSCFLSLSEAYMEFVKFVINAQPYHFQQ